MEIIDELIDGYKTVYRKALEGWDRSQADKEIRTVVDCPMDDAKNRRSVRTETRAGNPACLNQARGALDSIRKLLGLDAPAQVKIEEEEEEAPIDFTVLQQEDLRSMSDEQLAALAKTAASDYEQSSGRRRACWSSRRSPSRTTGRTGTTRSWRRSWTGWRRASAGG